MGHSDTILQAVIDAEKNRQITELYSRPIPKIAKFYLPAGLVDSGLMNRREAQEDRGSPYLRFYGRGKDSSAASVMPVPVTIFIPGIEDYPAVTTKAEREGGGIDKQWKNGRSQSYWEVLETESPLLRKVFLLCDDLAAKSVNVGIVEHERHLPIQGNDSSGNSQDRQILQFGLFVPHAKIITNSGGDMTTETDVEGQTKFLAHLLEHGYLDAEKDQRLILEAFPRIIRIQAERMIGKEMGL